MNKPVDVSAHKPIFKWETLREVSRHVLRYQTEIVAGKLFEVELSSGEKGRVWRADNGQEYFCHGLTFGGKEAPGGVISPFGDHVPTILHGYYEAIPESQAKADDILVWRGADANDVIHSAILTKAIVTPGTNFLDGATRVQTKNGILPETNMSLEELIESFYGEAYTVYREKSRTAVEEQQK